VDLIWNAEESPVGQLRARAGAMPSRNIIYTRVYLYGLRGAIQLLHVGRNEHTILLLPLIAASTRRNTRALKVAHETGLG
jgi:hypothetical protein